MKSHIGYFVLSVSGAIICILFFLMSQITPDINAKVTGENKTSNKIIMHIHSNLNVTVNGRSLIVPNGIGIIQHRGMTIHWINLEQNRTKTTIFGMITPAMSPLHS